MLQFIDKQIKSFYYHFKLYCVSRGSGALINHSSVMFHTVLSFFLSSYTKTFRFLFSNQSINLTFAKQFYNFDTLV